MAEDITLVDPRVARELEALALDGASGVMEVHGSPGGTIYIDDGRVTFAESPATPGLAARLTGSWLVPDADWSQLPDPADPNTELGGVLTGRGLIAEDQLRSVLHSAALDAIMALTAPAAGGSVVLVHLFMRSKASPDLVAAVICSRDVNLGMLFAQGRQIMRALDTAN